LIAADRLASQRWRGVRVVWQTHPMGESRRKRQGAVAEVGGAAGQPQVVDTLGGRMHVRWDEQAAATPHGQLVFFAEFLGASTYSSAG